MVAGCEHWMVKMKKRRKSKSLTTTSTATATSKLLMLTQTCSFKASCEGNFNQVQEICEEPSHI